MMVGDLSLIPPELKMGKPASPSSDLYAYGCLLLWVCFLIKVDQSFICTFQNIKWLYSTFIPQLYYSG